MENQMASLSTDPAFDLAADWQPKHYVALQPMAANRRKPAPAGRVDGYINPAAPTELLTEQSSSAWRRRRRSSTSTPR
jgi:hypothetical protein